MDQPIRISNVFPELTWRQAAVLARLITGKSNKEIGRELGISHRTVEDHRLDIYKRTGASSVQELAYRAVGAPAVTV